jgi:hypothetical protein
MEYLVERSKPTTKRLSHAVLAAAASFLRIREPPVIIIRASVKAGDQ